MPCSLQGQGRWIIARSDGYSVILDEPHQPILFGRSPELPPSHFLHSKYASREHLRMTWDPPFLLVYPLGKNPTLVGNENYELHRPFSPGLSNDGEKEKEREVQNGGGEEGEVLPQNKRTIGPLRYHFDETISEAIIMEEVETQHEERDKKRDEKEEEIVRLTVVIPAFDASISTLPPSRSVRNANTLYFPPETNLPSMEIRFEAVIAPREVENAAKMKLTPEEMLSIPSPDKLARYDAFNDSSEDENGQHTKAGGGDYFPKKTAWRLLFDASMRSEQEMQPIVQENESAVIDTASNELPASIQTVKKKKAPSAPISLPHAKRIPFGAPLNSRKSPPFQEDITSLSTSKKGVEASNLLPLNSQNSQSVIRWEWKCRANGKDSNPKSWCTYPPAVIGLLEEAFLSKKTSVEIPDILLNEKGNTKKAGNAKRKVQASTFTVSFNEPSLGGAMIQYENQAKNKFCLVRRTTTNTVDGGRSQNKRTQRATIISSSSSIGSEYSSSEEEEEYFTSDTSSSSEEEEEEFISNSSNSDGRRKKKKPRSGK